VSNQPYCSRLHRNPAQHQACKYTSNFVACPLQCPVSSIVAIAMRHAREERQRHGVRHGVAIRSGSPTELGGPAEISAHSCAHARAHARSVRPASSQWHMRWSRVATPFAGPRAPGRGHLSAALLPEAQDCSCTRMEPNRLHGSANLAAARGEGGLVGAP
jgi:hypothetical protein